MFADFSSFLTDNNIVSIAIATVISKYITIMAMAIVDNILLPIINRDADNDGVKDIKKYQEYIFRLFGINFEIGAFIIVSIKFIFIIF